MILNGVMAVTLRYFTEVGKLPLQKTICGGIYARVYCIFTACTMSWQRKFTFAISSHDEFLVYFTKLLQKPTWLKLSTDDNLIENAVDTSTKIVSKALYVWRVTA